MVKRMVAGINVLMALATGILLFDGHENLIYPQTCVITETDTEKDLVTIATGTGIEYQFTGIEDYCKGDLVSVMFWGNWTDDVTDDAILSHRYAGQPETYDFIVLETLER